MQAFDDVYSAYALLAATYDDMLAERHSPPPQGGG